MIDKETFIDTINFLEVLYKNHEKKYSNRKGNKYNYMYETTLAIKKMTMLLGLFFPNKLSAKTEIEFYCFCLNFGKPNPESEYITPGELYEDLLA
jgi:hypothetical protein